MSHYPALFNPITLGAVKAANRIFMAPLTRARTEHNHIPTPLMAEYYAQRASAGLIVAEATMAMEGCSAFMAEPGIYSAAQIAGWQQVTQAVHAKGGKIFLQIWHGGRACHPALNNNATPVAPSAIAIEDEVYTPAGKQPYTTPRALELNEIPTIIAGFVTAAKNAKTAGFDGVEVHGANGYLLDQFLRDGSNKRTDTYGGSMANRARLLLEVINAVCDVWGSGHVGVRLSPLNSYNSMQDSNPTALTEYLAQALSPLNLAYLHLMRADFFGQQQGDVVSVARQHYTGHLLVNMGYTAEEAATGIAAKAFDAVAFGVPFLANPDLPQRFAQNAPLNTPAPETFYTPGAAGYTDYPFMEA